MEVGTETTMSENMPEALIVPKTYTGTKMGTEDILASANVIQRIVNGENVPRKANQILEKAPYEKLGVVWMSPNKNRAERRANRAVDVFSMA